MKGNNLYWQELPLDGRIMGNLIFHMYTHVIVFSKFFVVSLQRVIFCKIAEYIRHFYLF